MHIYIPGTHFSQLSFFFLALSRSLSVPVATILCVVDLISTNMQHPCPCKLLRGHGHGLFIIISCLFLRIRTYLFIIYIYKYLHAHAHAHMHAKNICVLIIYIIIIIIYNIITLQRIKEIRSTGSGHSIFRAHQN